MKAKEKHNGFRFICVQSATGPLIVPYKLERSPRVKRMHLQINCPEFVVLKMPLRQAEQHGTQFLQQHGEWICRTLAAQPRTPRLREHLMRSPRLSLNGRWYRLAFGFQRGACQYLVRDRRAMVELTLDPRISTERQMLALLRAVARDYLPQRLQDLADKFGIKYHGVSIRDQRSRWGSCSETGGISLNWRLVLLPPRLQDHVMLHELAHMRHFNHSAAFHRLLMVMDPRAEEHARQLDGEASKIINLGRQEP